MSHQGGYSCSDKKHPKIVRLSLVLYNIITLHQTTFNITHVKMSITCLEPGYINKGR